MYYYAAVAYDAYCKSSGGVSLVTGDKLPAFNDLKTETKEAWRAAASDVISSWYSEGK